MRRTRAPPASHEALASAQTHPTLRPDTRSRLWRAEARGVGRRRRVRLTHEPAASGALPRGRQRSIADVAEAHRFRASAQYAHLLTYDTTEPRGAKCANHVLKLNLQ